MNTAARIEIIRNYKDLEAGHVSVFNALESLIVYRQKAIDKLEQRIQAAPTRSQQAEIKKQLDPLLAELHLFKLVEKRHLTMVDFVYKGLGTQLLTAEISRLQEFNTHLQEQQKTNQNLIDKLINYNVNLTKKIK